MHRVLRLLDQMHCEREASKDYAESSAECSEQELKQIYASLARQEYDHHAILEAQCNRLVDKLETAGEIDKECAEWIRKKNLRHAAKAKGMVESLK